MSSRAAQQQAVRLSSLNGMSGLTENLSVAVPRGFCMQLALPHACRCCCRTHRIHLADMPGMVERIKKQGEQQQCRSPMCWWQHPNTTCTKVAAVLHAASPDDHGLPVNHAGACQAFC